MNEEIIDYRILTIPYKQSIPIRVDIMEVIGKLESKNIFIDDTLFRCIANNTISPGDFSVISNIALDLLEYLNVVKGIYNINLQKIIISAEYEEDIRTLTVKVRAIVFADSWDVLIKVWRQAVSYLHDKYNDRLINVDIILTMNP